MFCSIYIQIHFHVHNSILYLSLFSLGQIGHTRYVSAIENVLKNNGPGEFVLLFSVSQYTSKNPFGLLIQDISSQKFDIENQ